MPSGAPRHAKAAYLLARVGRTQSVRFAERVQSIGLRPKHFAVLNAISLADGASQQEIGGRMGLDPSGLVGAIDELERMGLVERRRDPADRRRHLVSLTDAGRDAVRRLRTLTSRVETDFVSPLAEAERETLHALLLKLVSHHDIRCAASIKQ